MSGARKAGRAAWLWGVAFAAVLCLAPTLAQAQAQAQAQSQAQAQAQVQPQPQAPSARQTVTLEPKMTATAQEGAYQQKGGTVEPSTVSVSSNGTVGELPTPTPPTGWTFIGWYTAEVKTVWWNGGLASAAGDAKEAHPALPQEFAGQDMKNLRLEGEASSPTQGSNQGPTQPPTITAESASAWYGRYLVGSTGTKAQSNAPLANDVHTLYAAYAPTTVTVSFYWNGWQNQWDATQAPCDYGTTANEPTLPASKDANAFEGWFDSPRKGEGTKYSATEPLTASKNLYAHYSAMASDPEALRQSMIAASSIKVSPTSATVASGESATFEAELTMTSEGAKPTEADWANVQWTVLDAPNPSNNAASGTPTTSNNATSGLPATSNNPASGSEAEPPASGEEPPATAPVSLSATSGKSCTVTANSISASAEPHQATVTLQASFINQEAKTVAATATVVAELHHVHSYEAEQVQKAPTCQEAGYGTRRCATCGDVLEVSYPITDHTYLHQVQDPTCTQPGAKKDVCVVCGFERDQQTLPATGHTYGQASYLRTCSGRQVMVKTCQVCGHTAQISGSTAAAQNHRWDTQPTIDKPATCGTAGSQSIHCAACALTKNSTEIPPTGQHTWGAWHTTKAPTASAKGEQGQRCTTCGKAQLQELPVLVGVSSPAPEAPGTPDPSDPQDPNASPRQELYRLYNPTTYDHLYTASTAERDQLVAAGYHVETMEGATALPAHSTTRVYRLDNPYSGEHHYTTSLNEYLTLCDLGWSGQGVCFYSAPITGKRVYRLYNVYEKGTVAAHHYTLDKHEVEVLVKKGYLLDDEPGWYYLPN